MEEQPPAAVSVATGALGPILQKLTALLGDEQHRSRLSAGTRSHILSIRSMLASLHSLLLRIWEREDLGTACNEWMSEARAQSYDMEDDIDHLVLRLECSDDFGHGGLNKVLLNLKMRVANVSMQCREEWKMTTAPDAASNKRSKPSPADPRARFLHKDVSELVGMDRPLLELMRLLGDHEMVCIHGFAGTGKTTLADLVYQKIGDEFECRAFVSLSKSPDMLKVLGALLTQVTKGVQSVERTCTEATPEENLIQDISNFLSGKRYLLIVDDIWLWESWEIIRRALPKDNKRCKIIATTRVNAIAEKCCVTEEGATIYWHRGIDARAASELSYKILLRNDVPESRRYHTLLNNASEMISAMCGGMTLAVRCLSSAYALARDTWSVVTDPLQMFWPVLLYGLLDNSPALKPMVESLSLGYDDLPVHVKTCLLYCSIFPKDYKIERNGLVRKWITQGFFPKGPEQEMEAAAEACLDELASRGLLQQEKLASSAGEKTSSYCSVHHMMRAFLLWKSKVANFATFLDLPPHKHRALDAARGGPLFVGFDAEPDTIQAWVHYQLQLSRVRSIVVFDYSGRSWRTLTGYPFPWSLLRCVRALSIEGNPDPLRDPDLVAICTRMLRLRHLSLKGMPIRVVPPEIGRLQHLETLDVSGTCVRELPKQIGKLHHLKILNITAMVSELPWLSAGSISLLADGKKVKLPRGLSAVMQSSLREKPGEDVSIVLYIRPDQPLLVPGLKLGSRHFKVPKWIKQHLADVSSLDIRLCKLEQDDLEFLSAMPNLQVLTLRLLNLSREPIILAGIGFSRLESFFLGCSRGHMTVPGWVKQQLAKVSSLDIRIYQLVDDDLDFLCNEMPFLKLLTLRLEVLPGNAIVITGKGFLTLKRFSFDCRLPLVIFQEGAMPKLEHLEFNFYASRALPIEEPVGIRHLLSLKRVVFQSSRYKSDALGISAVINKVRDEAKEHCNRITISINGKDEEVIQEKKKATMTSASSDRISEENIVTKDGGPRGSSGTSIIQTRPVIPYNTGTDDDEKRGNIIPVKSYYPFGVTE